jgi:hypothetical protein
MRASVSFVSTCAATLVALCSVQTTPRQLVDEGPSLVALQRVPAQRTAMLTPAAISFDGRLVAYVARNPATSPRYCCQSVYVA